MRILINATNVAIGGGLTRNLNFINAVSNTNLLHELILLAPKNFGYEDFVKNKIKAHFVPKPLLNTFLRLVLDYIWIKKHIINYKPDVVFNMVNLCLPFYINQATIFADPFTSINSFTSLNLSFKENLIRLLRNYFFYKRIKYNSIAFTQTSLMRSKIINKYNFTKNVYVVPNSYSLLKGISRNLKLPKKNSNLFILCFARYYEHKNIEILLEVSKLIKRYNSKIKLLITISKKQGNRATKLLNNIIDSGLQNYIINIGEIHYNNIKELYSNVDGLILPSILESYSSTYADAMYHKKPVFTSNLDFAKEICGEAAFYFNPWEADEIYNLLESTYQNTEVIEKKLKYGYERIMSQPNWIDISKLYIQHLEQMI